MELNLLRGPQTINGVPYISSSLASSSFFRHAIVKTQSRLFGSTGGLRPSRRASFCVCQSTPCVRTGVASRSPCPHDSSSPKVRRGQNHPQESKDPIRFLFPFKRTDVKILKMDVLDAKRVSSSPLEGSACTRI